MNQFKGNSHKSRNGKKRRKSRRDRRSRRREANGSKRQRWKTRIESAMRRNRTNSEALCNRGPSLMIPTSHDKDNSEGNKSIIITHDILKPKTNDRTIVQMFCNRTIAVNMSPNPETGPSILGCKQLSPTIPDANYGKFWQDEIAKIEIYRTQTRRLYMMQEIFLPRRIIKAATAYRIQRGVILAK